MNSKHADNWKKVKLDEIVTLESGSRPRGGVRGITEGVPSLGGEHLNAEGGFSFKKIKYIPEAFFQSLNKGQISPDDIIVVKDGATTGKTSFVGDDFPYQHAAVNEHCFIVRVDPEVALPKFVFYYLFSYEGHQQILSDFRGATVGGISRGFPQKVDVPLPTLAEQHRIVTKLEALLTQLDAGIDTLKRVQRQFQEYRQSLLKAAFDGELTKAWRDGDSANWENVKLDEIVTLESGSRPRGGVRGITEGVPSLGGEHLNAEGGFSFRKIKYIPEAFFQSLNKGQISPDDIIVVKDGATTGKTSFVGDDFPYQHAAVNEHCFIVRVDPEVALPKYVFYYLFSSDGQQQILSDFRGATVGGISRGFPLKVDMPLPPLSEQDRIISELEHALTTADEIEATIAAELTRAEQLRQSLFEHAFSGKLVPQDPNDEPAETLLERIKQER